MLGLLVTMDAEQGVEMMRIVRPQRAIPIHYNDYDVFTSSLSDFNGPSRRPAGTTVEYVSHGQSYRFRVQARQAAA